MTFFFWFSLDFGGKLDVERREELFLVFHRYFQWKRKQEFVDPPFQISGTPLTSAHLHVHLSFK